MTALERLKEKVGQDTYNQILEVLGGEVVYFPTGGTKADNEARNSCIRRDYYGGMNYRELSRKYGLCVSQICKIVCSVMK